MGGHHKSAPPPPPSAPVEKVPKAAVYKPTSIQNRAEYTGAGDAYQKRRASQALTA